MQPAKSKSTPMSGMTLIVMAIVFALIPVIGEMIASGGPSHMGDPETGYFMVLAGVFMWPAALICFIIGLKRTLSESRDETLEPLQPQKPVVPKSHATITDAWAEFDKSGQPKKEEETEARR